MREIKMSNQFSRRNILQMMPMTALVLSACGRSSSQEAGTDLAKEIFALLSVEMERAVDDGISAGLSFGVNSLGGRDQHSGALGVASIRSGDPVTHTTQFRIASVTKTFVAVGVMQLIETGKLNLSQPIAEYFPDYPRGNEITIYNLLTHTSGLKDWWEAGIPEDAPGDFMLQPEPNTVLARAADPFHFAPGEHHWYSNTGFVLLGNIIERIAGEPLYDYMDREVFARVDLKQTAFERPNADTGNWADGHHNSPTSNPPFSFAEGVGSPGAAGGIRSTAADMLRWSEALHDGRLIHRDTLLQMSAMAILNDGRPVSESTWVPEWMGQKPDPTPFMQDSGWGLGFSLFHYEGQRVVWHSGGIPGFNAIWMTLPDQSLAITMLSNTDNGVVPAFNQVTPAVLGYEAD